MKSLKIVKNIAGAAACAFGAYGMWIAYEFSHKQPIFAVLATGLALSCPIMIAESIKEISATSKDTENK